MTKLTATYTRTCPRCNGTGFYDRGVCFTCKGAKAVRSAKLAAPVWEVSAVFKDGARRVVCTKSGTEQAAIAAGQKKMALGPEFWQADTIRAKLQG